jgi:hypothetical protein
MCYKILNNIVPVYFKNYVSIESETIQTRNNLYKQPLLIPKSAIGKKSFRYRSQQNWLNLPENLQTTYTTSSLIVFQEACKTFLINKQRTVRMKELFDMIDEYEFYNMMNM